MRAPPDPIVRGEASSDGPEVAARFILDHAQARAGRCAYQGRWPTPLSEHEALSPSVRVVATERVRGVPLAVARALVLWAEGARVVTYAHVPLPMELLRLQAVGARCVSLLPANVSPAPHEDALAFVLHDLCHLDKFLDPAHHVGQVGFFSAIWSARPTESWACFEAQFDTELGDEWNHVIADMNGSAVFLFAAMKMKLKMATRRRCARELGVPPEREGPLTAREQSAYDDAERVLFELIGVAGELEVAARGTSTNRSDPSLALRLLHHFEAIGRDVLAARSPIDWPRVGFADGNGLNHRA